MQGDSDARGLTAMQVAGRAPAVTATAHAPTVYPATALIAMGGVTLGIPVANLREVMVHPPGLQPLPAGGPFAMGCVALRGQVIPVLDLSAALNLPPSREGCNIIAILRWESRIVGLRAQAVRRIVQSSEVLVQEMTPAGSEMARLVLPRVALVGLEVVSLLDASALLTAAEVPHTAEQPTRSRHLDRSSQFLLCEIGGWRYCVSVRNIEATLAETAVDSSVLAQGSCEGAIERHGLKMALMNPQIFTGFVKGGARPAHSGGIVLKLEPGRGLTLRADRITDILHLQRSQITAIPPTVCDRPDLFQGVVFDAKGLPCYVLDIDRLTADPEAQALARIAHRKDEGNRADSSTSGAAKGVPGTAIFVRAGGLRALAIEDVVEILQLPAAFCKTKPRYDGFIDSLFYRDSLLAVFCMSWLAGERDPQPGQRPGIVVVRKAGERIGLLVEDIVGIERVHFIDDVPEFSGGPATRLAMRQSHTSARFVALWPVQPAVKKERNIHQMPAAAADHQGILS